METSVIKALPGDSVVHLPRAWNNTDHWGLRSAQRAKSFQFAFHDSSQTYLFEWRQQGLFRNSAWSF